MAVKYDIFLSYRRDGGYETAKHLYDLLTRDGYTVSFDIDTLKKGDFDEQLLSRIDQCKDFILIVDKDAFTRTINGSCPPIQDWLRCELSYALSKRKNIIPVFLAGANGFPSNLPEDIIEVTTKNGPKYNREYFDAFYEKLRNDFLNSRPSAIKSDISAKKVLIAVLLFLMGVGVIFSILEIVSESKSMEQIKMTLTQTDSLLCSIPFVIDESTMEAGERKNVVINAAQMYSQILDVLDESSRRHLTLYEDVKYRYDKLSSVVDSLNKFDTYVERINYYNVIERFATAEKYRTAQKRIAVDINYAFSEICGESQE